MRTRHHLALAAAVIVGAFALLDAGHGDGAPFAWRSDLDKAVAEAERSGKPLMIVFR